MTSTFAFPLSTAALEAALYTGPGGAERTPLPLSPPKPSSLREIQAEYHVMGIRDDADDAAPAPIAGMQTITLCSGQIFLGEVPLRTARWEGDRISWVQETEAHFSAGDLLFRDGEGELEGWVCVGASAQETVTVRVSGRVAKPRCYDTEITKSLYAPGHDPGSVPEHDWEPGRRLEIGYTLDERGRVKPEYKLADAAGEMQKLSQASTKFFGDNTYQVQIFASETECSFVDDGFYSQAELSFNARERSPAGTGAVRARCGDEETAEPEKVRLWTARPCERAASDHLYADAAEEGGPLAGLAADTVTDHAVLATPSILTLMELSLLTPPDAEQAGMEGLINSALTRNMKYAMGKKQPESDWLTRFMGQRPPHLTKAQQELADKGDKWYEEFCRAYLTNSFNQYTGPGEPETRLNTEQAEKLAAYFRTGIAAEEGYNLQHQGLYMEAYLAVRPRLQDYIADGGRKWAEAFYEDATSDDNPDFVPLVNSFANPLTREGALRTIKQNSMLLLALDPTGEVAGLYSNAVMTGVIGNLSQDIVHQDVDLVRSWIPDNIRIILTKIADGRIPDLDDLRKNGIDEIIKYFNDNKNAVDTDLAQYIVSQQNVKTKSQFTQMNNIKNKIGKFLEKHQKIAKFAKSLGQVFALASWGGAVVSAVLSVTGGNWEKMNTKQRTEVVTNIVGTFVGTAKAVKAFFALIVKPGLEAWAKLVERTVSTGLRAVIGGTLVKIIGGMEWIAKVGRNIKSLLGADKALLGKTIFGKIFAGGWISGVVKLLGVAVSVTLAVLSFITLLDAITSGRDIAWTAVDFAISLAVTATTVAGLFFSSVMIPVFGAALAVVGIVVMAIRWWLSKPPNPVEDFMKDAGLKFVDSLPEPSPQAKALNAWSSATAPPNPGPA
ncbi:hypothetical protein [Actinocorallia populi]|uniref:hypothetical protein n=1 Tax=Actinocorallia populi TaxID=2079200 RepID=UPI000D0954B2|nr:hypothetical protein [Actinocorallia populi]